MKASSPDQRVLFVLECLHSQSLWPEGRREEGFSTQPNEADTGEKAEVRAMRARRSAICWDPVLLRRCRLPHCFALSPCQDAPQHEEDSPNLPKIAFFDA